MALAGALLILIAWSLLALSMDKHYEALLGRRLPPARSRRWRLGAVAALIASLACFIVARGWEQGPVFWTVALMLGALVSALLLTALQSGRTQRSRARR
ncbi:DUF3325 domain-containing protein [Lysobacter korlensis]|uniref:DUF3325 domain-containing protein n=1 Tax=Lysobacter korlensis TaxID=553636 RepID=A0ABV6RSS6_9GAMM